jgi:RNA polymerase sigma-70 factor (ECF subfamily)
MFRFARKNTVNLKDDDLVEMYRLKGDIAIAGILYDRYAHLVYGVCLKYLRDREASKDAVMEIFEKVIVELREKDVRNFKSWLYVVSRNFCLMELRKIPTKESIIHGTEYNDAFIMESYPEMHPIDKDRDDGKLKDCIEKLSEEQKQCIELFYYKEKCYKEISNITNFDLKKVKSHIQNGKRNLKNCMEKYHDGQR